MFCVHWVALTEADLALSPAETLRIDPVNPNILYYGTGKTICQVTVVPEQEFINPNARFHDKHFKCCNCKVQIFKKF